MDLKGIFGDLLTLEVSTIVRDGMTAHKMPALPFALLDIIHAYADTLLEFGVDLRPYFEVDDDTLCARLLALGEGGGGPDVDPRHAGAARKLVDAAKKAYQEANDRAATTPEERRDLFNYMTDLWPVLEQQTLPRATKHFSMAEVSNGWDAFERLRIAANQTLDMWARDTGELAKSDMHMLERIVGSCSRLKFIVQGLQRRGKHSEAWDKLIPKTRNELLMGDLHGEGVPLDTLRPEHQATVRKIWEIGTERILAQTSVQIDGDVFTRISPSLLEQHDAMVRDMILAVHREGLEVSLRYWKQLVEIAEKLVRGLLGRRLG